MIRRLEGNLKMGKPGKMPALRRGVLALLLLALPAPMYAVESADCPVADPSVSFSSTLALPPASGAPWDAVRSEIAQGHFEQARRLLDTAPPSGKRRLWEGILLLQEKRTFASIRSLEQAAQVEDTSTVETLLGLAYLVLNQRQLLEQALKRALNLDPKDERAHYLAARYYFTIDDVPRAQEEFTAVLSSQPNDYRSLYYLGDSEWRRGDVRAAKKHFLRTIQVISCNHISFHMAPQALAQLELEEGQKEDALQHADMALTMATQAKGKNENQVDAEDTSNVLLLRGKIFSALGRQEAAENDWRRAVSLNPALAAGWYLLARLYQSRGQAQQASDAMERFRKIRGEL